MDQGPSGKDLGFKIGYVWNEESLHCHGKAMSAQQNWMCKLQCTLTFSMTWLEGNACVGMQHLESGTRTKGWHPWFL